MSGSSQRHGMTSRRKQRTRTAIVQAFNELVIGGAGDEIRVRDVIARANVGRSTFYEHFANVTDLYMHALSRPLSILVECVAGDGDAASLEPLLQHIGDNRRRARNTFSGRTRDQVVRLLTRLIRERLAAGPSCGRTDILALQLAELSAGLLRAWLHGELVQQPCALAQALHDGARRLRGGHSVTGPAPR